VVKTIFINIILERLSKKKYAGISGYPSGEFRAGFQSKRLQADKTPVAV
jgi:hypothetical protein